MTKFKIFFVGLFILTGCRHKSKVASPNEPAKPPTQQLAQGGTFDRYDLKAQILQKLPGGEELKWGGLSALSFIEQDAYGNLFFWSMTDRGPNGVEVKKNDSVLRSFLIPDFHPSLVKLRVNKMDRTLEVVEAIPFKNSNGEFLNGLPPTNTETTHYEIAVDGANQTLVNQGLGIDPESLTVDDEKHFWVGEEYQPSLLEFDAQGTLLIQIKPATKANQKLKKNQIPFEYRFIKLNRGFEAIGYFKDRIYFMTQSPLDIDPKPKFIRIGVFNIKTRRYEAEYLYPLENLKVDKIGDLHVINEKQMIVLEQNGETGPNSVHRIYKVDLSNATNVLKAGFQGAPELTAPYAFPKDFSFVKRTLLLDLVKEGYSDFEKVEGLTLIDESTAAVINDNDFGLQNGKFLPRPTALGVFKIKN